MFRIRSRATARYLALALLSCQQYAILSFLYAALPALLRSQGVALEWIGMFGLAFLAFTLNALWAPLLDRPWKGHLPRRRTWLLALQLGCPPLLLLACLLDPAHDIGLLLLTSMALATLVATQRIAAQAYAAERLPLRARPTGASIMGWGVALGNIIGGGLGLLALFHYGWRTTLVTAALLAGLTAWPLRRLPEPRPASSRLAASMPMLRTLWFSASRPGILRTILIIAPATLGIALGFAMATPWLVDLGFGLDQVGPLIALGTLISFSTAGPLMGCLLRGNAGNRHPIPFSIGLILSLLCAGTLLYHLLPSPGGSLAALLAVFSALAMQSVAFNSHFYALARPGHAATDITLLNAAMSLAAMAGFTLSGFIASDWGYQATLTGAIIGCLATALLAYLLPVRSI